MMPREEIEAMLSELPYSGDYHHVMGGSGVYARKEGAHLFDAGSNTMAKFAVAAPAIIRQLLAKVDEAAKIEELLKTHCTIQNGVSGSPDILYCNNEVWTLQGFTDTTFDSLHAALTSLVGGGK